jgi:hypothetical protein
MMRANPAGRKPTAEGLISFIIGNKSKFLEAKEVFANLSHINLDLPEIQELDPKRIIKARLIEARKPEDWTSELYYIREDKALWSLDRLRELTAQAAN